MSPQIFPLLIVLVLLLLSVDICLSHSALSFHCNDGRDGRRNNQAILDIFSCRRCFSVGVVAMAGETEQSTK